MASLRDAELIDISPGCSQRVVREDDKLIFATTFNDDACVERNNQIRAAGFMDKLKLGLHENEDVRMAISCPSVTLWNRFKKFHPDTYDLIMSGLEHERVRGCRQLQILHPTWVVQERL